VHFMPERTYQRALSMLENDMAPTLQTSSANLQVSSTTQAIAYALLSDWGYDTFFEHTRLVSEFYRKKRDVFAKAMERHLTGLAEWTIPEAGMFFWLVVVRLRSPVNLRVGEV
jgi:DNA-binding transcriptional MocR family regulator